MRWEIVGAWAFLCFVGCVECKPNGSPASACFYMTPRHMNPYSGRKVYPTHARGLYNITVSADIFRPDRPLRVTLWGPPFKGFMMSGVEEGSKDWPAGVFYSEDGAGKKVRCLHMGDTITHTNNSYKDEVSVLWYGPENFQAEQIRFVATVVVNMSIFYTNIKSQFIRLDPSVIGGYPGAEANAGNTGDPWLSGTPYTEAPWYNMWGRQQQQQPPRNSGWQRSQPSTWEGGEVAAPATATGEGGAGWNTGGTRGNLWNTPTGGSQWNTGSGNWNTGTGGGWNTGGNQWDAAPASSWDSQPVSQQEQQRWNQPLAASINWNQQPAQPYLGIAPPPASPTGGEGGGSQTGGDPWAAEILKAQQARKAQSQSPPLSGDIVGNWGAADVASPNTAPAPPPADTAPAPASAPAAGDVLPAAPADVGGAAPPAGAGKDQATWLAQKLVEIYSSLLGKIGPTSGAGGSSSSNPNIPRHAHP